MTSLYLYTKKTQVAETASVSNSVIGIKLFEWKRKLRAIG